VVADIAPVAYGHDQTRTCPRHGSAGPVRIWTRAEADRRWPAGIEDARPARLLPAIAGPAAEGGPRWRLNLPVLEAEMPKIVGWPGTPGRFDGPTLFLTGAESHYVRPEHRDTIRALFPKARFAKMPGAGHWLHAEKPREFEETVRVFLEA
jgi:esterase